MRRIRFLLYMFLFILFSIPFWGAQYRYPGNLGLILSLNDSIAPATGDSTLLSLSDSISLANDSLPSDSVRRNSSGLDAIVYSTAKDSMVFTKDNWGYLYGEAEVKYGDIVLTGERLSMDMDSSLVYATFGLDSVGKEFGFPVFADRSSEMEAKSMKYNFRSRKGYTTNLITQQGEGYVVASRAKKNEDNSFFMLDGIYTTCDNHEHPHFYLALTKGKVRPGKNVVTGPAYLVIEGLPLYPIGLPFGFFPFSSSYSSGVIMPSYGQELERGFNLRDGGYYFAINDNVDLALTGEIYTKGSWGINARSSYRKRYKYSGSFDGSYIVTKLGEKGINYTESKDMRLRWSHSQDPKANQFRTISASVDFSTSSYNHNSLNTLYSPEGTQNTKSSSVNITQRFPNSPWSLSASMSVAQRTQDSTISMTLPNLTISMSSHAPFKRKQAVGSEKWYEKIMLSYNGDLRNSISTKEDLLFKSSIKKDWQKAMRHTLRTSATFNVLEHLNITPSLEYTERWYTEKMTREWDADTRTHQLKDTTYGFYRVYNFSASLGFQTKLYGMYKPLFYKKADIRHVFTPSISLSYAPDFSDPAFGFYETYTYYDANSEWAEYTYSPFQQGMFGTAPNSAQGMISFQFDNNVEMKLKTANDSTRKISLIDNLGISFSHNMMADSLKWSDITTNIRLKLSKSLTVNIGAAWDPYMYRPVYLNNDPNERITGLRRVNDLRIANGGGFGRLRSTGYSISPSINQDTFKKWFGKKSDDDSQSRDTNAPPNEPTTATTEEGRTSLLSRKEEENEYDADGYIKNQIKWSLSVNFSMNYNYNTSDFTNIRVNDKGYAEYRGRITKNLSFSGNIQPTANWTANFNANYDFDAKKISYMTFNLTRDLHCWEISASVNPVGQYKSYFITLRAKSSLLRDLKYEQRGRSSGYDPDWH